MFKHNNNAIVEWVPTNHKYSFKYGKPSSGVGYEVSSAGDKRFSAFFAKLPNGKTIESSYQKAKGSGKGKPSIHPNFNYWETYLSLWQLWAKANPHLIAELWLHAQLNNMQLTDKFAKTENNQARALAHILNSKYTNWGK